MADGRSAPGRCVRGMLRLALFSPVVALGWQSSEPLLRSRRQPISARSAASQSSSVLGTTQSDGGVLDSRLSAGTSQFDEAFSDETVGVRVANAAAGAAGMAASAVPDSLPSVKAALSKIEDDMKILDEAVGPKAQLTGTNFAVLASMVSTAFLSPFLLPETAVEVVVPSAAAVCTAVAMRSEFTGKVSVADGKQIASETIKAAAEAEALLAAAEREKAVIPLCTGTTVFAMTFALLAPAILEGVQARFGLQLITELYLIGPIIATVAAALGGLAARETKSMCGRATGLGVRRFAKSTAVAGTWLSSPELVMRNSQGKTSKYKRFLWSLLPGPLCGAICPGALETKAIMATAISVAQTHYYFTSSDYAVGRAIASVALKKRIAAVSDAYANQGFRSGAILPYTSAIAGLSTALTAAVVEFLPNIPETLGVATHFAQAGVTTVFPACGALFAAAASVAKARCKTDASAAMAATEAFADTGSEEASSGVKGSSTPWGYWWSRRTTLPKFMSETRAEISARVGRGSSSSMATA